MKEKSKKNNTLLITLISLVIILIIGSVIGYEFYSNSSKNTKQNQLPARTSFNRNGANSTRMNLQLNDSQIEEVNAFFNTNPAQSDIQTYCSSNRANCFYYCRNNPNVEACIQIMNFSRSGSPGNFSRYGFNRTISGN